MIISRSKRAINYFSIIMILKGSGAVIALFSVTVSTLNCNYKIIKATFFWNDDFYFLFDYAQGPLEFF